MNKKALSKPLSSPSRQEKFPPPLMRFLRSNVGSKSRGRSRASPMFYLRSRKTAIETAQEPSSPKVTCIGQVRVRRNAKKTGGSSAKRRRKRRCCWWKLKKALFRGKKCSWEFCGGKGVFGKWGCSFFRFGYCKKVDDATEDCDGNNKKSGKDGTGIHVSCDNDFGGEDRRDFVDSIPIPVSCDNDDFSDSDKRDSCSSSVPPRNALMLTRCRSAPYRSSSLGSIFLADRTGESEVKAGESEDPGCGNAVEEARASGRDSCDDNSEKSDEESKGVGGFAAAHPLLLTRCKSEPARTGERLLLNPDASLLILKRRLDDDDDDDVVEPCSHSLHSVVFD